MIGLKLDEARRLAVAGQMLDAPQPRSVLEVVERLGGLQLDPTNAVARAELLVLWSRLGAYDLAELNRLLWEERALFQYWAFIVPTADFGIHREVMGRALIHNSARDRYAREWVAANAGFKRYILGELRKRGPLRSRDLEDRAAVPWGTGGWNDGKSLGRMLEILWARGEIVVARREGTQRVWDLAERYLPVDEPPLSQLEVARRLAEQQVRWRGVARRKEVGVAFDGRAPDADRALDELVREKKVVPVGIDGVPGEWYAHAETLERGPGRPRTTLLAPFDKLISNRDRTEELWGFRYRIEIYVPKAKREYGYYVLPILHGHELIGRLDPLVDRKAGVLHINAVYAEPGAPEDAGRPVAEAVRDLANWLGATEVAYTARVPRPWKDDLRQ